MWSFRLIISKERKSVAKRILNELLKKTKGMSAEIRLVEDYNYCHLDMQCDEYFQNSLEYFVSEQILEIICVDFKKEFLFNLVRIANVNLKEIVVASLIEYDKENDFFYLTKKISLKNVFSVDSFFYFMMQEMKLKWKELADVANNYFSLIYSSDSYIEFVKYIVDNIDFSSELINVVFKENKVFLFDSNFKKISHINGKLTIKMISLSPKKINCFLENSLDDKDVKNMFNIFFNRIDFYPLSRLSNIF